MVEKTGGGVDAYDGMVDPARVDRSFLRSELGWLPADDEWQHLLFGRGSADQLGGVVAQIVATRGKILYVTITGTVFYRHAAADALRYRPANGPFQIKRIKSTVVR